MQRKTFPCARLCILIAALAHGIALAEEATDSSPTRAPGVVHKGHQRRGTRRPCSGQWHRTGRQSSRARCRTRGKGGGKWRRARRQSNGPGRWRDCEQGYRFAVFWNTAVTSPQGRGTWIRVPLAFRDAAQVPAAVPSPCRHAPPRVRRSIHRAGGSCETAARLPLCRWARHR